MTITQRSKAENCAEIIAHLARLAYADRGSSQLTTAQWTALRYFGTVNRFSRSLSAFADYHGTSRSSASQTIKSLIEKGFLVRSTCKEDNRSARIELTEQGRSYRTDDPFEHLVHAIEQLSDNSRDNLAGVLDNVLACASIDRTGKSLGMCQSCQFLKEHTNDDSLGGEYFCKRSRQRLSQFELSALCMNFRPKNACCGDKQVSQ